MVESGSQKCKLTVLQVKINWQRKYKHRFRKRQDQAKSSERATGLRCRPLASSVRDAVIRLTRAKRASGILTLIAFCLTEPPQDTAVVQLAGYPASCFLWAFMIEQLMERIVIDVNANDVVEIWAKSFMFKKGRFDDRNESWREARC